MPRVADSAFFPATAAVPYAASAPSVASGVCAGAANLPGIARAHETVPQAPPQVSEPMVIVGRVVEVDGMPYPPPMPMCAASARGVAAAVVAAPEAEAEVVAAEPTPTETVPATPVPATPVAARVAMTPLAAVAATPVVVAVAAAPAVVAAPWLAVGEATVATAAPLAAAPADATVTAANTDAGAANAGAAEVSPLSAEARSVSIGTIDLRDLLSDTSHLAPAASGVEAAGSTSRRLSSEGVEAATTTGESTTDERTTRPPSTQSPTDAPRSTARLTASALASRARGGRARIGRAPRSESSSSSRSSRSSDSSWSSRSPSSSSSSSSWSRASRCGGRSPRASAWGRMPEFVSHAATCGADVAQRLRNVREGGIQRGPRVQGLVSAFRRDRGFGFVAVSCDVMEKIRGEQFGGVQVAKLNAEQQQQWQWQQQVQQQHIQEQPEQQMQHETATQAAFVAAQAVLGEAGAAPTASASSSSTSALPPAPTPAAPRASEEMYFNLTEVHPAHRSPWPMARDEVVSFDVVFCRRRGRFQAVSVRRARCEEAAAASRHQEALWALDSQMDGAECAGSGAVVAVAADESDSAVATLFDDLGAQKRRDLPACVLQAMTVALQKEHTDRRVAAQAAAAWFRERATFFGAVAAS